MTTETYDNKPKFDPNKPYKPVGGTPKFDPGKPFQPAGAQQKVKKGEVVFEEPAQVSQPPEEDIISLSRRAEDLGNRTIDVAVTGGVGGGTVKQKDFEAEKEANKLRKQAKDRGYDTVELTTEFEGFPEVELNKPGKKEELLELRKSNPIEYRMKLNATKNQYDVLEAVKNNIYNSLPEGAPNREWQASQSAIHAANEFNNLNIQDGDSLNDKYDKILGKLTIINENVPAEQREKMIRRVEEDAAQHITGTSKQLKDEWQQSEFAGKLDPNQYAGLKTLQLFEPEKYKQAVRLLGTKSVDRQSPILDEDFDPDAFGEAAPYAEATKESKLNQAKGEETVKKQLADIGRANTIKQIHRKQYSLDQAYKDATEEEKPVIAAQYMQYDSILKNLTEDARKDDERYPLLAQMKFDEQVKEIMQDPGFTAAGYGAKRFGKGFKSSVNSLENILTSTFGSQEAKDRLEMERLGQGKTEGSEFYLPETYRSTGSQIIPKFSKEMSEGVRAIYNDDSLSLEEREKRAREFVSQNQDKVDYVTNTDAGKSRNFFSKATLYGNAGMLGDIASIAAQSMMGGAAGAGRIVAATVPMFTSTQNDFYQQAVAEGNPNPMSYANTHATIMALAGLINPDLAIVKRSLGVNSPAGKFIAGIDESTWNNVVNGNKGLVDKFKNSATSVAKEAGKMTAVYGAGTSIASDLADKMLGGKDISMSEIVDNAVEATKHTALNSVALFGLNAVRNFKTASPMQKANIWEAGTNPDITIKQLEDAATRGEISPEQAKTMTESVKEISKLMDEVPTENAKGKPLTDKQRIDYLYNKLVASKAKDLKQGTTEAKTEEMDSVEQQANSDNNKIVSGYPREEKSTKASVIMPGELKQPETITIKPDESSKPNIPEANTEIIEPSETGSETAIPTKPAETTEGQGEEIRLSHADTEQIYKEHGLPERLETPTKKDSETIANADKLVKEGYDFDKESEKVMKGEKNSFTDEEQVAFAKMVGALKEKQKGLDIKSPEFEALQDKIEKYSRASDVVGTLEGRAFRARQTFVPKEESLSDYVMREKEVNKDAPLTDQQKETVQREFNEISEAEKAYQQKISGLEAENARLRAEKSLPKKSSQKTKKTHEDYVSERKQIFTDIKEKLRKARGESQATIVPYAKELIAISPDVAKLVKNLVEEGVTKLADIVKEVHGNLTDVIPDITEKDVHDIIAGEYSQKKTQNELAAKLRDLRDEAKLINKLEALERGEEPATERKKIQRNQEITALREKIKNLQKGDKDELAGLKTKTQKEIDKIEEQLKTGDFSEPAKPEPLKLDEEAKKLKDELIRVKNARQLRMLKEEYENSSKWNKIQTNAVNAIGIPRALMATGDFSAVFRQALLPTVSHPMLASKAAVEMFKSAASKKNYDRWFYDLENSPRYELMKESGLALTDTNTPKLDAKEEQFMNNAVQKIPLLGRVVKGSERAYSQYLNKMRVDLFNRFADQLQKEGRTFENSKEAYKQTAAFVNNMTGRGDMGKTLNESAPILNQLFFSPRLMASRVNTLTYFAQPRFYKTVPKQVRMDYFRSLAATAGLGLAILGLAKLNGAETEDDPRSSEFGKIKVGNTRWDLWGGHQQYIRAAAQILTGKKKTGSGEIVELGGEGPYSQSRGDVGGTFMRGKLSPVPSLVVDLMKGENIVGEKLTSNWESADKEVGVKENLKTHLLPLLYTGLEEAMKDQGTKAIFTVGVPSAFGVGVNTYGAKEASKKAKPKSKPKKKKQQN